MKLKRYLPTLMTFLLCLSAAMTFEQRAHAYVDPGSGLLIFQVIGTLVTGSLLWCRRRIKNFFNLGSRDRQQTSPLKPLDD